MKGTSMRKNLSRDSSMSIVADVVSYVLNNGPGNVSEWRD